MLATKKNRGREIESLLKALDFFRRLCGKAVPSQQLVLFLTVVENPGITMPELCRKLDMPQGSVSRNVKSLSRYREREMAGNNVAGHDLLRTEPDAKNPHCLAVYPTRRGHNVALEMAKILDSVPEVLQQPGFHALPDRVGIA